MSDKTGIRLAADLIPEIYYDLIARIIPGLLLLVGLEMVSSSVVTGGFAVQLCLAYISGMLLTPFATRLLRIRKWSRWERILGEYDKEAFGKLVELLQPDIGRRMPDLVQSKKWDSSARKRVQAFEDMLHAAIKERNQTARLLAPKLLAEVILCFNTSLVAVILLGDAVWEWHNNRIAADELGLWSAVAVVVSVLAFSAGQYRHERLIRRQLAFLNVSPSVVQNGAA